MRIPRFFAAGSDLDTLKQLNRNNFENKTVIKLAEDDLIKQMRQVLRLGHGHRILLLDGQGRAYELVIERMEKTCALCLLENISPLAERARARVRLVLSLIKVDRFEWCIEKATELGVDEIVPVFAHYSVARSSRDAKGEGRLLGKLVRWQSIAREAAEQSERATIPQVVRPRALAEFLDGPTSGGATDLHFICVERLQAAPLAKALAAGISTGDLSGIGGINSISLLIGPEGGFTDVEIATAQEQAWVPVTLGPRILRSETAAIVAMSQVASVLDI
jgi:16S rRNA (uracil1498-N3)-methyltransferase